MEEEARIIFPLNIKPSLEEFLGGLAIKNGGLAAQLFKPIYEQFFVYSQDIKEEYVKYYSIEYPTLGEYIEICHGEELSEEQLDKNFIYKFKNRASLLNPVYDGNYFEHVVELLKKMEKYNEA